MGRAFVSVMGIVDLTGSALVCRDMLELIAMRHALPVIQQRHPAITPMAYASQILSRVCVTSHLVALIAQVPCALTIATKEVQACTQLLLLT